MDLNAKFFLRSGLGLALAAAMLFSAGCPAPTDFVPVTGISGAPSSGAVGVALVLTGTVEPDNATNQTILWTLKDPGTTAAVVNAGILTAAAAGTATVTATIVNGATETDPFSRDFAIAISAGEDPPPAYTVSFDSRGGSEAPAINNVASGARIAAPVNPVKTGYAFGGWHKEAALTSLWDFAVDTVNGDTVLYAKWTAVSYAITYNLSGGTNAAGNPAAYTIESAAIALAAPSRSSYSFGGWFDNSGFSGAAITSIAAGSVGDRAFWAKWNETGPAGITISYWVNEQEQEQISSSPGSATVSRTGSPLIIAADGAGYSDQHWYVNGVEDLSQSGQESYSFSAAGRDVKTHTVGLVVKKDDQYYSAQFAVTVTD
jgi:uncharacterized repeat protein (TIGR02543 family)